VLSANVPPQGTAWTRTAVAIFAAFAWIGLTVACGSREPAIPKSQHAKLEQQVGRATITIEYSRPVARGRRLFGGVVPFGKPWNPGADAATTIRFSRDVEIDGHALPRGTYSVWAIPGPDSWTLILSRAAHVFHEPYPQGQDALRFPVVPAAGPHVETLAFYFPLVDADSALLFLHWGETVVPIHLRTR
jgi:hypothetical protein